MRPWRREIGVTGFHISGFIARSGLTVFPASPVWERISDQRGRKRVMLVGLFRFAAGTALFNSVLYAGLAGLLSGCCLPTWWWRGCGSPRCWAR